jgi:hypothetical protein
MSDTPRSVLPPHIRVVRAGHGANCSSIGSVIDTLFVTAVAGGAVFAAIAAALSEEPIRTVDRLGHTSREPEPSPLRAESDGTSPASPERGRVDGTSPASPERGRRVKERRE